jgi:hypothetical protein
MRIGLRTTILALLLAASHPVTAGAAPTRVWGGLGRTAKHMAARTVPATIADSNRLGPAGRVTLATAPTHVAFSWRGAEKTGVEYRTISSSGVTDPWREATEAHDMERGNQHYTAVESVDRPAALDWRRIKPRGAWMGAVTLDSLNTLDGTRVAIDGPAIRRTSDVAGVPEIVTRSQWGADESIKRTSGSCERRFYPVQQLFVHHTAGSNFDPHPMATMRAIYWYHTVRRGWCDIGYNFVIGRDGSVFEGRWARHYRPWERHTSENSSGRAVAGAHVSSYNSGSVGISLMGNFDTSPLPPDMRRSLAEVLAWEVDRHGLQTNGSHTYRNPETGLSRKLPFIAGHRDAGQTACPGKNVYLSLKGIRRDTKAVIGAGKDTSSLTVTESPVFVDYGQTIALTGTLVEEAGVPLGGQTVNLYERVAPEGWREHSEVVTGEDGSFSITLDPATNTKLLAVYEGDTGTWGSQSKVIAVKVRHVVTLAVQGQTPDAGGQYHLPASTPSLAFVGTTAPVHSGRVVEISVQRLNPDGTYTEIATGTTSVDDSGAYSFTFLRPDVGANASYIAIAKMGKDQVHAFGASPPLSFTTDL